MLSGGSVVDRGTMRGQVRQSSENPGRVADGSARHIGVVLRASSLSSSHQSLESTMSDTNKTPAPTPNDQRSDTKNPNNPDHKSAQDNRANQINPNHAPTKR